MFDSNVWVGKVRLEGYAYGNRLLVSESYKWKTANHLAWIYSDYSFTTHNRRLILEEYSLGNEFLFLEG